ncbi:MAG: hypothetical protein JW716_02565 [Candidatus Aenigmarchaeota archaeon]|nr:hypothetical protein [Candidatus Aenigmarchaeota archaeon]
MDIITILPTLLIGMIIIVIVPFVILITIFLRMMGNGSRGILEMLAGFLLMCTGYLFMFFIAITWGGSNILSTAITNESLVLEANYMAVALFSIPVIWVIASVILMKDGYKKYKELSED